MAKTKGRKKGRKASSSERSGRGWGAVREVAGVVLIGLALVAAIGLGTYDAADPFFQLDGVANAAGAAGATIAGLLVQSVGAGAAVLVLLVLALGVRLLLPGGIELPTGRFWLGATLLMITLSTVPALLASMAPNLVFGSPGWLGDTLAPAERALLSGPGALALNALVLFVGVLGIAGVPPGEALARLGRGGFAAAQAIGAWTGLLFTNTREALATAASATGQALAPIARIPAAFTVWREQRARRARVAAARDDGEDETEIAPDPVQEEIPTPAPVPKPSRFRRGVAPDIVDHEADRKQEPEQEAFTFTEKTSFGPYTPPDVGAIFQSPPAGGRKYDRDSLIMNSRILEKKLADFGVNGRVVTVHPGPVITMYEFEPAPGVKVNKITNLSDDLALALRALSIRIIAPIPGKSVVGIEVPNPDREVVYIRDLLEAKSFRNSDSRLSLALGKDIFGNPVDADLAKMPHLLVAGATGTGKSVFLNSLLCSIL